MSSVGFFSIGYNSGKEIQKLLRNDRLKVFFTVLVLIFIRLL